MSKNNHIIFVENLTLKHYSVNAISSLKNRQYKSTWIIQQTDKYKTSWIIVNKPTRNAFLKAQLPQQHYYKN